MADESSNDRKPGTFNEVPIIFKAPWDAVRADPSAENNFIAKTTGIKFAHWICLPDPLYQSQQGDIRHSFNAEDQQQFVDSDRFHRENEFIYKRVGEVYGMFQGNHKDMKHVAAGLYGDSGAVISLNRHYIDCPDKVVKISENDKLVPCELSEEFFSVNWQKFTHNPTGIDRLQFKAEEIVMLIDSQGIIYTDGKDFNLENGYLKWNQGPGADRPGTDPKTGTGKICSVRYTYKPYYYVKTTLHDIRIRPQLDEQGVLSGKAMPVQVVVQADWVYLDRRTASENDVAAQLDEGDGGNTGPR